MNHKTASNDQASKDGQTWYKSTPLPFYVRRWFKWHYACYPCWLQSDKKEFIYKTQAEYSKHYQETHNDSE